MSPLKEPGRPMLADLYGPRQFIALLIAACAYGLTINAPSVPAYPEPIALVSVCIVNPIVRPA